MACCSIREFFKQGIANEAVLQLAEYELARTWFGWRVRPRPEAQILMGRGVGLFGLVIAAEGRGAGPASQHGRVPGGSLRRGARRRARQTADGAASRLFARRANFDGLPRRRFFSLHWKMCAATITCAPRCAISFMPAREATPVTKSSGPRRNPRRGRTWRKCFASGSLQPGIPEDFRARYQKASSAKLGN